MTPRRLAVALALLALPLLVPAGAHAEVQVPLDDAWTLSLKAQIRPRLLLDSGLDFRDGDARRAVVTQRSRLGVGLAHQDGVRAQLTFQDIRLWGEELETLNDFTANGFDVHEAYVRLPVADTFALTAGRQEINLDAQRLVGAVDWAQRARSFDALRISSKGYGFDLDVFYAKVDNRYVYIDGNETNPDTNVDFGGIHVGTALGKSLKASALYLFNGRWHTDDVRHTAGLFATGASGGLNYTGELYYQFGSLGEEDVSAMLAAARAGYTLAGPAKPSATVWAEYVSGDGTAAGTFDTLYATNHKFYGEMDFFLNIPVHTGNLGLIDLGGQLAAVALPGMTASLDFHHLMAAESDANGESVFGQEIDLRAVWKVSDRVGVQALYGIFLPGEAARNIRPAGAGLDPAADLTAEHFGYLTLDVTL